MKRPSRSPQASLFSGGLGVHVLWVGAFIGIIGLLLGYFTFDPANPADATWQTMLFTTLAFSQIGQALASRSSHTSLFALGLRSNPTLLVMILLVFGLQLAAVYSPGLEQFFGVVPLTAGQLLITLGLGSLTFIAIEIEKFVLRRNGR
jgi:Ca2+-transporting ATPase